METDSREGFREEIKELSLDIFSLMCLCEIRKYLVGIGCILLCDRIWDKW